MRSANPKHNINLFSVWKAYNRILDDTKNLRIWTWLKSIEFDHKFEQKSYYKVCQVLQSVTIIATRGSNQNV